MPDTVIAGRAIPGAGRPNQPIPVEFLYSEDCPSHERALALLEDVIREEGVEARIHTEKIETEEDAEMARFPGSPTIRVNGFDIDDNPSLPIGLACRAYRSAEGKISPLPPREKIVWAVQKAAREPQIEEANGNGPALT